MTITPAQADRLAQVTSPLGQDVLLLRRMTVTEALSEPFVLEFDLLSQDADITLSDLLGEGLTFSTELPSGDRRHYHGLVTDFALTGSEGEFATYRAICRPWLWFLSRSADCRIFQEKKAPDIIKEVFRDFGFSDFEDSLSNTYRTLTYCVQYRESAFRFVSRLMEDEGIYYYFKHEEGKHTLVLADDYSAHAAIAGESTIPFIPPEEGADLLRERIQRIGLRQKVRSGKVVLNSYEFETPGASLVGTAVGSAAHTHSDLEVYDYDADYRLAADGDQYSTVRLQEFEAGFERARGEATARNLAAGGLFTLSDHPRASLNVEYLLIATRQVLAAEAWETGHGEGYAFKCSFLAMNSSRPFRAPRNTPRALVRGPQTAVVVGKQGEEIWTDRYGRIKVQFHWDRYGAKDENSSCWLRVAQMWSGGGFGGIQIPRMGEEVIVDFLEGDPDRPLVVGRVYNADNMPPNPLPDDQTKLTIKTRSSPEGTADNFNELTFEDKKDEEEVYFHAEKNFNRVVENDDTLKVGFEKMDPGDRSGEVYNNESWVVGNNQTIKVGYEITDPGDREISVANDEKRTIEKNQTITIGGNQDISIGGAEGGSQTVEVEVDRSVTINTGNDNLTVSQGDYGLAIDSGEGKIEAAMAIEFIVGGSSLKIEPAKITLKSPEFSFEADGKVTLKGATVSVDGSGSTTIKGGTLKIN